MSQHDSLKVRSSYLFIAVIPMIMIGFYLSTRTFRYDSSIKLAKSEMNKNQFSDALNRLQTARNHRVFWLNPQGSDELQYLESICLQRLSRFEEAVESFRHIHLESDFFAKSSIGLSDLYLEQGYWRNAEETLRSALRSNTISKIEKIEIFTRLDRYYRMQSRFSDASEILGKIATDSENPLPILRDLWRTSRGTPPYETIEKAIKTCETLNPNDSRLWLAKANVSIDRSQFQFANDALDQCERPENQPDNPVHLARMKWAKATNQPGLAIKAAQKINPDDFSPNQKFEWALYFAESRGNFAQQKYALESWFKLDPYQPVLLSKYSTFATNAGDSLLSQQLRERKASIDRGLESYNKLIMAPEPPRTIDELLKLSQIAYSCGRPLESRILCRYILKQSPNQKVALELLSEIEKSDQHILHTLSESSNILLDWIGSDVVHDPKMPVNDLNHPIQIPEYRDDSLKSNLVFQFRNGETEIRQMPVTLSSGVALIDYDNDGWVDVFVLQGGDFPHIAGNPEKSTGDRLFRNLQNGTFEDTTEKSGLPLGNTGYGHGVSVGDINNDGFSDLFITRYGSYLLYVNQGNGRFVNETDKWGLGGHRNWPTSSAFADLDNDGDLDLYVCHYVVWDELNPRLCRNGETLAYMSCNPTTCKSRPDHLFRNDNGKFTDISESSGITNADLDGRGLGVVAADFDDDGLTDLFVANDKSANFLFHNKGKMIFEEVAQISGVAGSAEGSYQAGMGVACGDYDQDGRMDLAVTNYYGESTTLYQNLGGLVFADRTASSGLASASRLRLGFGIAFTDTNNDGFLDLFTANGHTDNMGDVPYRMPAQILLGQKNGRWLDTTDKIGEPLSIPHLGRGLAVGDIDNDGLVDTILLPLNEPLVYFKNTTQNKNHWMNIRLIGTKSNRDGVGSKIRLKFGSRIQFADRIGGGSYQSANDQRIHFGFQSDQKPDFLEIRWPSGRLDLIENPPYDMEIKVTEGSGKAERLERSVQQKPDLPSNTTIDRGDAK